MARFEFRGKYAMRVMKKGKKSKGSLLAYFTVVDTKLGIEFRDVKLLEGKNGIFVAGPSRAYEDKEGETKYSDYWRAAYDEDEEARDENGVAYLEAMAEAAYKKYQSIVDSGDDDDEEEEKPKRRSGRGPVSRKSADDDDEEEDEKPKRGKRKAEDDDEDEEEEKPKGKKRPTVDDDEDEDEEEEKPKGKGKKKALPF